MMMILFVPVRKMYDCLYKVPEMTTFIIMVVLCTLTFRSTYYVFLLSADFRYGVNGGFIFELFGSTSSCVSISVA